MGRIDVDAMLAEITPEQFDMWWASAILDGWDGDGSWQRMATIASESHNAGVRAAAAAGASYKDTDLKSVADFMPAVISPQQTPGSAAVIPPDEAEAIAAARWG